MILHAVSLLPSYIPVQQFSKQPSVDMMILTRSLSPVVQCCCCCCLFTVNPLLRLRVGNLTNLLNKLRNRVQIVAN